MKIPSSNGIKAASAATIAITETLPEFYDILLSKYTYHLLVSAKDANMSAGGTLQATKSVIDLPSFRYSAGDCLQTSKQRSLPSSLSFFCERQITWSVNLTSFLGRIPLEESVDLTLLARFTAVRRFIKREFQPADASRGLLLPAAMSHLSVYYHRSHQADDVMYVRKNTNFKAACLSYTYLYFQNEYYRNIFIPIVVCGVYRAARPDPGHGAVQQCPTHHACPRHVDALQRDHSGDTPLISS